MAINLIAQQEYWNRREQERKVSLVREPVKRRYEPTIHDILAADPTLKSEPWVQRLLDVYNETIVKTAL